MDTESEVFLRPKNLYLSFESILDSLENCHSYEEKIGRCLEFMRSTLSDKPVRFKDYWEIRRLSLSLFKETLSPSGRYQLWKEYLEISTEAKLLRERIDHEASFAAEQIDLAIQSIEKSLKRYEEGVAKTASISFPDNCHVLEFKRELYESSQRELNFLNTLAIRINSLRKELLKIDLKLSDKNRLFHDLSRAGNEVFPKRKELINRISSDFLASVFLFVETNLNEKMVRRSSIFKLREEIKSLQILAKELSLDTVTFNQVRIELGKCWDFLKEQGKERKKESFERRDLFQKNFNLVMEKIKSFGEWAAVETSSAEEAIKHSNEIFNFMSSIPLGADDVKKLREEIYAASIPVTERVKKKQKNREKEVEELQKLRRDKIEEFKHLLQTVLSQVDNKTIDELLIDKEELQKQLSSLSLSQAERELLEYALKELRDKVIDKKEKAFSTLSAEQLQSRCHLKQILEGCECQRQELRTQLEKYRKMLSSSSLGFEKAMLYRDLSNAEKIRLDKVNTTIKEIKEKIEELEQS